LYIEPDQLQRVRGVFKVLLETVYVFGFGFVFAMVLVFVFIKQYAGIFIELHSATVLRAHKPSNTLIPLYEIGALIQDACIDESVLVAYRLHDFAASMRRVPSIESLSRRWFL
jgi:hypothetical protein